MRRSPEKIAELQARAQVMVDYFTKLTKPPPGPMLIGAGTNLTDSVKFISTQLLIMRNNWADPYAFVFVAAYKRLGQLKNFLSMDLRHIVCSPQQAAKLVGLGIDAHAALYFWPDGWDKLKNEQKYKVITHIEADSLRELEQALPSWEGEECELPAWTKAEIDAMIGPRVDKPDFWKNDDRQASQHKVTDPWTYPVFYPKVSRVYPNGSEASADVLIYLLENKVIPAKGANEFRKRVFGW